MTSRNKIILIIGLLVVAFGALVIYALQQLTYTAAVKIEAAPLTSNISINGQAAKQGITKLRPGDVTIKVTMPGFDDYTTKINVADKETKYVGVLLKSNDPSTADWYDKHPEDQSMAEGIASKLHDASSQKQIEAEPFLKELPFTAAGFEFKIDYGAPPANSNKPTIYIQADTQAARDDALTWITYRGYDPSKMNIVYSTMNN